MKVVILLGGHGTRMRPHAWSRPKPLLRVANHTVIGHILDQMQELTTEEVILVVGYKGEQIRAWVEDHYHHLDLHFVTQQDALGQAHALWLCRKFLRREDGDESNEVVVALGDVIIEADFGGIARDALPGTAAVFQVMDIGNADPGQFGVVRLGDDGFISRIVEKPTVGAYSQAVAGVYWFRDGHGLWELLDETLAGGRQTRGEHYLVDAFQLMLERRAKIGVQPIHSIADVGSPQNRLQANRLLLDQEWARAEAAPGSGQYTVIPPVYVHPTATISASVVGPYVTIGRDARLDHVVIENSIVDDHARIHHLVLADSIVGERVRLCGEATAAVIGDDSTLKVS